MIYVGGGQLRLRANGTRNSGEVNQSIAKETGPEGSPEYFGINIVEFAETSKNERVVADLYSRGGNISQAISLGYCAWQ